MQLPSDLNLLTANRVRDLRDLHREAEAAHMLKEIKAGLSPAGEDDGSVPGWTALRLWLAKRPAGLAP